MMRKLSPKKRGLNFNPNKSDLEYQLGFSEWLQIIEGKIFVLTTKRWTDKLGNAYYIFSLFSILTIHLYEVGK